jgi:hypothetical protein
MCHNNCHPLHYRVLTEKVFTIMRSELTKNMIGSVGRTSIGIQQGAEGRTGIRRDWTVQPNRDASFRGAIWE